MIDRRNLLLTSLSAIAVAGLAAACRAPLQTDAPDSEFFLRENSPPEEIVPKLMVDDSIYPMHLTGVDDNGNFVSTTFYLRYDWTTVSACQMYHLILPGCRNIGWRKISTMSSALTPLPI